MIGASNLKPAFIHLKTPRFQAGKTTLYADFDGTYMLFDQDKCCKSAGFESDPAAKAQYHKMYDQFDHYTEKNAANFEFVVTTGRNKWEFLYFIRKLLEQGLSLTMPKKLITKNGGDEFSLPSKGMPYQDANLQKRSEIKAISGWDGSVVRQKVTRVLQEADFKLITFSPSNNQIYEYGDSSLEYKLRGLKQPGKEAYASIRDDGELNCHIAFPQGFPGAEIAARIREVLKKAKIEADVQYHPSDGGDAIIPHYAEGYKHDYDYQLRAGQSITIVPVIHNSPYQNNGPLSKLYDIRKKLKQIIDENSHDLVVVAGNGSNDEPMLNPFNYIDLVGLKKPSNAEEETRFLADTAYIKQMKKLPFAAIVVGNDASLDHVTRLAAQLNTANVKKIIAVDGFKHTLLEAIRSAKSSYGKQDRHFAQEVRRLTKAG